MITMNSTCKGPEVECSLFVLDTAKGPTAEQSDLEESHKVLGQEQSCGD